DNEPSSSKKSKTNGSCFFCLAQRDRVDTRADSFGKKRCVINGQRDRCQHEEVRVEIRVHVNLELAPEHEHSHDHEYGQWDVSHQVDECGTEPAHGAHRGGAK